jgi:monoamine oxidase
MTRSEHAHFLRSMAADHAAADQLGLPIDEYRGLRDEAMADHDGPSRRALLGRAAALGLGAAALGTGVARPRRASADTAAVTTKTGPTTARIAIIGAGISGLNAALTLADKGVASTV